MKKCQNFEKNVRICRKKKKSEFKDCQNVFFGGRSLPLPRNRDDEITCDVAVPLSATESEAIDHLACPWVIMTFPTAPECSGRSTQLTATAAVAALQFPSCDWTWQLFFLGPGLGVVGGSCGTEIAPVRCNFTHRLRLQRNQNTEVQKHTSVDRKCFSVFVLCSSLIPKITMLMCIYKVQQEDFICM